MDCLCPANRPLSLQSLRQLLILLSRSSIWSSHLSLSQRIFRIPLCVEENFDRSFSFHRSSSPLDAVIQFRLRDFNSLSLPSSEYLFVVSIKRHFYTQSVWRPANILQHSFFLFLSVGEWSFNWSDEICIADLTLFSFLRAVHRCVFVARMTVAWNIVFLMTTSLDVAVVPLNVVVWKKIID